MFEFIRDFRGEIPGAAPRDCGNWQDQNLNMANWLAERYLTSTLIGIDEKHLIYPE
jgi:S-ribosylhomocysteine lyase